MLLFLFCISSSIPGSYLHMCTHACVTSWSPKCVWREGRKKISSCWGTVQGDWTETNSSWLIVAWHSEVALCMHLPVSHKLLKWFTAWLCRGPALLFCRVVSVQGFPRLEQDVGPSMTAMGCGLVAMGSVEPMRPCVWCLLFIATNWWGGVDPVQSQSFWWSIGAAVALNHSLGRPRMLSVMLGGGEKCAWESR